MRDATRKALDAAKRDVEAGRLDDAFKRAGNLLRYLSGQEYEEAREEWSTFLWVSLKTSQEAAEVTDGARLVLSSVLSSTRERC